MTRSLVPTVGAIVSLGIGNVNQGDIGGWFDFVFYITTGVTTGGILTLQVEYVV